MSVNLADFRKALVTVWNASGLNAAFQALYGSGVTASEYAVLRDSEAAPSDPFPYCVFEIDPGVTTDRMSGDDGQFREIRDLEVRFNVHTRSVAGDSRTPAEIAAALAEEVQKVFGGHPTVAATPLVLDNGNFLVSEYQNDFGIRTEKDAYQWVVVIVFKLDVPVMV